MSGDDDRARIVNFLRTTVPFGSEFGWKWFIPLKLLLL